MRRRETKGRWEEGKSCSFPSLVRRNATEPHSYTRPSAGEGESFLPGPAAVKRAAPSPGSSLLHLILEGVLLLPRQKTPCLRYLWGLQKGPALPASLRLTARSPSVLRGSPFLPLQQGPPHGHLSGDTSQALHRSCLLPLVCPDLRSLKGLGEHSHHAGCSASPPHSPSYTMSR